jgi:CTP synthase
VIVPMEDIDQEVLGGTIRLGLHPSIFQHDTEWSKLRKLYDRARLTVDHQPNGTDSGIAPLSPHLSVSQDPRVILERHRYRYEVSPKYREPLTQHGLGFIGKDDKGLWMEMLELKDSKYHVGVQFHPEYVSKVLSI